MCFRLTGYALDDTIMLTTLVIRRMNMKRKIFMLLAIIGFVVLMLCSCSEESYYKNEIKRLEKLGFTVVGDTDDAIEYIGSIYVEFFNNYLDSITTSTGNSGSGLITDPYNQDTSTSVNNSSNSGLVNDPYEIPPISEATDGVIYYPYPLVTGQPTQIITSSSFTLFDEDHVKEAVLLQNIKGEVAVVALFTDESSASTSTQFLPTLACVHAGPWFGKTTTFVAGPTDVIIQLYPAMKEFYD